MSDRYDIVLYGATGFTGVYVLEALAKSAHQDIRFAVAGRCEQKLKKVLKEVSESTGHDLTDTPIIIADSSNENSLVEMAKKAKIIINVVGPYRLYGESVVKAAVENGASHVDISGEPAFLEKMQMKYSEIAKQNGAYVVGACGWDSIPCDLGVNFLKQHFDGTLNHAETFVSMNTGPSGYSFNSGTYQTLILGIAEAKNDGLGKIRKSIMPEKLERSPYGPEHRPKMWYNESFNSYVLPFPGADRSVVQRSQYFDAVQNKARPVAVETYILVKSKLNAVLMMLWLGLFAFFVQFPFARSFMQKYPDICSAYLFKSSGPSRQQVKEASFTYWMFGKGWDSKDPNVNEVPTKVLAVKCQGPDPGYVATAGCVLSSALTILKDHDKLPHGGGVFTTTAAFKETKIYDRLAEFGIHFTIDENIKPKI